MATADGEGSLKVQCHRGSYIEGNAAETLKHGIKFCAFPCWREKEALEQLEKDGIDILKGKLDIVMRNDQMYSFELSSPDVRLSKGLFTITKMDLQQEFLERGYLSRDCEMVGGANIWSSPMAFDLKLLKSEKCFHYNPNSTTGVENVVDNTFSENNNMRFHHNSPYATPKKQFAQLDINEITKPTAPKKPRDSGYSGADRRQSYEEPPATPLESFGSSPTTPKVARRERDSGFDGVGSPESSSSTNSDDSRDLHGADKRKEDDVLSLMCAEEPPEKYWELLAEERRKGLDIALKENEELADEIRSKDETIRELRTELSELKETEEFLASVLEELGKD